MIYSEKAPHTHTHICFCFPFAFVKTVALFFTASLTVRQRRTSAFSEYFAHFLVSIQSSVNAYEILSFFSNIFVLLRTVSSLRFPFPLE